LFLIDNIVVISTIIDDEVVDFLLFIFMVMIVIGI